MFKQAENCLYARYFYDDHFFALIELLYDFFSDNTIERPQNSIFTTSIYYLYLELEEGEPSQKCLI